MPHPAQSIAALFAIEAGRFIGDWAQKQTVRSEPKVCAVCGEKVSELRAEISELREELARCQGRVAELAVCTAAEFPSCPKTPECPSIKVDVGSTWGPVIVAVLPSLLALLKVECSRISCQTRRRDDVSSASPSRGSPARAARAERLGGGALQ